MEEEARRVLMEVVWQRVFDERVCRVGVVLAMILFSRGFLYKGVLLTVSVSSGSRSRLRLFVVV